MEQRAYQSGLVQQAGFQPKKRAKFDKQRAEMNAQAQRNQQARAQAISQNNAVDVANSKRSSDDLKTLAAFSSTLTDQLIKREEKKNQEEMERGMAMAFTDGVTEQEQADFDSEEQQLKDLNEETVKTANKIEGKTGNVFLGEKVRNMSGWAAYGYAMGKAQTGGVDYQMYLAQAATDTVVNITTESGEVKPVTLATADNPAEFAAVQAQIRSEFLKQYAGMNPALLNKYMFPTMREVEGKALIRFSKERGDAIKKDRVTQRSDGLLSSLQDATNSGESLLTFVQQIAPDVGGFKAAREEALRVIRLGLKNGDLDAASVTALLDSQITIDGLGTKEVRKMWAEFGNLESELANEALSDIEQQDSIDRADARSYARNLRQEWSDNEERGEYLTEEQKDKLIKESMERYNYVDPSLKELKTQQDVNDDDIQELLIQKMKNGQPITAADLRNASPELYRQYAGQIQRETAANALTTQAEKRAVSGIKSLVIQETGETDGLTEKTPKFNRMINGAEDFFRLRYQEAARVAKDPREAFDVAMGQTRDAIKAGMFTEEYDTALSQEHGAKVVAGSRTLEQWALNKDVDFGKQITSQVIPGTEDDIQILINNQKNGINTIPPIYQQLSAGLRDMSAFDLARAQYMAATGKDMVPPAAEQVTSEQSAEFQRLLKYRPTSARTRQAMVGSGDTRFLDLVASEESEAYGGYDAYNKGGNYNGTVAYGSGNSAVDNQYGKPISQLTIGEIKKLHADGKLHAAGRYQFIKGTFAEVVEDLGLSNDTVFDAATQDRMAISRARWRVKHYGLRGLKNEWVGLQKLPQAKIDALYKSLDPYNQPDVLTPGVRKLAYVTGDIGNGAAYTGQHLDVKSVDGKRFADTALDNYVEIDDPKYGTVPLSKVGVTGNWESHTNRGSHGIDYGTASGSNLYVKNGAKVISSVDSGGNGDLVTIELPTGKQFTFLHGRAK